MKKKSIFKNRFSLITLILLFLRLAVPLNCKTIELNPGDINLILNLWITETSSMVTYYERSAGNSDHFGEWMSHRITQEINFYSKHLQKDKPAGKGIILNPSSEKLLMEDVMSRDNKELASASYHGHLPPDKELYKTAWNLELQFYQKCLGRKTILRTPFLQMDTPPDDLDTILFQIGNRSPFTLQDFKEKAPILRDPTPIEPLVFFNALYSHFRRECLKFPEVEQKVRKLPHVLKIMEVMNIGEECRLWREKYLLKPPTDKEIRAFYDNRLDLLFRRPDQYSGILLNLAVTSTTDMQLYETVLAGLEQKMKEGRSIEELYESVETTAIPCNSATFQKQVLDSFEPVLSISIRQASTGKIYGPIESGNKLYFYVVQDRQKGEPIPYDSVKDKIVERVARDLMRRQWTQLLDEYDK